jgi:hypothetical protein
MKIAILYICTGKYEIFWKDFYISAQKNFLPNHEKHYFVFTDAKSIYKQNQSEISVIPQKKLGWPYDTLMRFKMFLKVKEELRTFDYIFFLNANAEILDTVDESILNPKYDYIGAKHPVYWDKENKDFIYDRNPKSLACIPQGQGEFYYMGSFNGGKSEKYIKLIEELSANIDKDLKNKVIAIWHDESHLNSYFLDKNVLALSPEYTWAERMNLPFKKRILLRDKKKWGGHNSLRASETICKKFLKIFTK